MFWRIIKLNNNIILKANSGPEHSGLRCMYYYYFWCENKKPNGKEKICLVFLVKKNKLAALGQKKFLLLGCLTRDLSCSYVSPSAMEKSNLRSSDKKV